MSAKPNPLSKATAYVRESKEELEKVTWPSRPTVIRYTLIVIVACVAVGAFFALLDWGLSSGFEQLVQLAS